MSQLPETPTLNRKYLNKKKRPVMSRFFYLLMAGELLINLYTYSLRMTGKLRRVHALDSRNAIGEVTLL